MVADIVDHHELATGKRQEGIFFAAISFATKATSGVGSLIAGIALDLIHWPRGAHIQSAADIPVESIAGLGMICGPIVAGCAVFNVLFNLQCKMTREDHDETLRQLALKRSTVPT